ncbi:hypothetical protein Pcaca01_43990 [Pectobacterium carotovorum subsp. carotovorum]|nr:hypothetical protein Pcaca01_43990 [Pectobacterium carotovorum subsp. carotovorum]
MATELLSLRAQLAELRGQNVTNAIRAFVTDEDIKALNRFAECCDDPESGGHDLEQEQVMRLEKIGALQRHGRISYITDFGDLVISLNARPVLPAASQPARDVWKWCCEYQYNKDWPALDYEIFDHQHEAEEKARDTEGNVFPIYKSTQETQVDFLPKNLDRALTIMGIAIPESKEEFNFQSERWIQRLINAVLRMGKQSQPYTVPDEMTYADAVNFIQINGMCNETREGIAMRVHNHCRAAMLQSGNSPVWSGVDKVNSPVIPDGSVPEGYALVPGTIYLDESDIESICSQCGDGGGNYGDFTRGILWVGDIQDDEGNITHGLHISSDDYPEEGGITLAKFSAAPQHKAG